jgi:tetratricopeptide (TPR) repeat protein
LALVVAAPLHAATALNAIPLAQQAAQPAASAARQTSSDANASTPGTVPHAPRSVAPELEEAWSLAESGAATQAEKIVRQFLGRHPQSPEGHFLLGYVLFREIQSEARVDGVMPYSVDASLGSFRDAHARESLAEYTVGAKYAAPSAFDLKIVAFDYVLLDDPADADKWLTRVVEWNPRDADAWYNLGRTKYSENRFDEAIHAFQQCLAFDPKNVKAEDNLGLSYYGLGRTNDALAAYQTAIAWEKQPPKVHRPSGVAGPPRSLPPDPQPFIDLGILYLDQNRPNDALPVLAQATQIAPEDATGHEELGKAYTHLNDLPKAQAELEKAVALAPNVASLHFMLGQVYRKLGMMDKAKAEFERTEQLNGTHSSDQKPH